MTTNAPEIKTFDLELKFSTPQARVRTPVGTFSGREMEYLIAPIAYDYVPKNGCVATYRLGPGVYAFREKLRRRKHQAHLLGRGFSGAPQYLRITQDGAAEWIGFTDYYRAAKDLGETEHARCVFLQSHRPPHTTATPGRMQGVMIPGYPTQSYEPGTVRCTCGYVGPFCIGKHEYLPYAAVCPRCQKAGGLNWATHTALAAGTILQGAASRGGVRVRLASDMQGDLGNAYHVRKDGQRDRRYTGFSASFRIDEWTVVGGGPCA